MIAEAVLLKYGCLLATGLSATLVAARYAHAPDSALQVRWLRYQRGLDSALLILGASVKGRQIAVLQLCLAPFALAMSVVMGLPVGKTLCLILIIAFGPKLWLSRALERRASRIELDINGFLVALANSLKASPSLGKSFARVETVLSGPLAAEIGTVTRDLRLGASVDQALLALGARVKSPSMDAALTGILIGRQVGGNLPDILETTAETLREMERLTGIIRAKTAEGKAQMFVIALAPPVVFFAFDSLQHNYFDPFLANFIGLSLLAGSIVFWLTAVILARKILAVDV